MKDNSIVLCKLWNDILLSGKAEVCTPELKSLRVIDMKLLKLCYHNESYKIKDYLSILSVPNSSLTNVINRLSKQGLIERVLGSSDLRSFTLRLTDKGRSTVENHYAEEQKLFSSALSSLSEPEQDKLIELLRKLASNF